MKKMALLIVACLVISLLSCTRIERADIAIQNVTVIDATGTAAKVGITILIAGNRIRQLGSTRKIKVGGTFVCPTLVVWSDPAYREKAAMVNDPRLALFPSELKDWFRNMGKRLIDDKIVADLRRICSGSLHLVGEMNRAGVKILAGTDSGSVPFVLQSFSLHDELRLLVEGGLSPMDALQAATANAAECAGRRDTLETIEVGKIADLVLLEGNPLSSIANTLIKDIVRRVLAAHYRPMPHSGGPSWLTFIGHLKDSLGSIDPFRCAG